MPVRFALEQLERLHFIRHAERHGASRTGKASLCAAIAWTISAKMRCESASTSVGVRSRICSCRAALNWSRVRSASHRSGGFCNRSARPRPSQRSYSVVCARISFTDHSPGATGSLRPRQRDFGDPDIPFARARGSDQWQLSSLGFRGQGLSFEFPQVRQVFPVLDMQKLPETGGQGFRRFDLELFPLVFPFDAHLAIGSGSAVATFRTPGE